MVHELAHAPALLFNAYVPVPEDTMCVMLLSNTATMTGIWKLQAYDDHMSAGPSADTVPNMWSMAP